jgi:DNA-nicking Smr family endonuclease
MGKKKADTFSNSPFRELKARLEKAEPAPAARPPSPPPAGPGKKKPAGADAMAGTVPDEARLFYEAVADVRPLQDRGEAPLPRAVVPQIVSEEAEALAQLSELVSGEGHFDISDSDEAIAAAAPGVNRELMAKLRRGEFPVEGHLDLHGMTQKEARDAVERFLVESHRAGKRCVLMVHGRGLHSQDQIPVLKEAVASWLQRGRIAQSVLAFATARPHHGGAGAVYVLLRR